MSMVNKEPYITPEMIAAWNAGGGGRAYNFDVTFTPSQFINAGSVYFAYTTLTIPESVRSKKLSVTFKATSSPTAWISINQEPAPTLADTQLQVNFFRPSTPSANLTGVVSVVVYD